MTIGVILCAWQSEDLIEACLAPWLAAKRARLGGHSFTICAVSVPFEGFPQDEERDNTRAILGAYANRGEVDHVIVSDKPMRETDARGKALMWLVAQGVDTLAQWDSDELTTVDELGRIFAFVESTPLVTWYRLSLRNAVFDSHTFLAEPFTPPRIHRVQPPGSPYRAHSFWDDNDVAYGGTITRDIIPAARFASMTVPAAIANPLHLTWPNSLRSKAKCVYQERRWGPPHGNGCSFRWDEARGLVWNEAYFARTGQPIPEVVHD